MKDVMKGGDSKVVKDVFTMVVREENRLIKELFKKGDVGNYEKWLSLVNPSRGMLCRDKVKEALRSKKQEEE